MGGRRPRPRRIARRGEGQRLDRAAPGPAAGGHGPRDRRPEDRDPVPDPPRPRRPAIGFIPGLPSVELAPDVVFLLFLPPILFAAGYFTSIRDLRKNLRAILLLAVGLVLFTTFLVGAVAKLLVPDMAWAVALTLGAIVSPPDAVAASAVFQRLGVPRRIVTILEGESLLNDATALVAYRFAVVAATVGGFSIVDAGSTFLVASVGGIAVGLAFGFATTWAVRRVNDPVFSIVITLPRAAGRLSAGDDGSGCRACSRRSPPGSTSDGRRRAT